MKVTRTVFCAASFLVGFAGCGRQIAPADPVPSPAPMPAAPVLDELRVVEPPPPPAETIAVAAAEVTKQAVAVFGDSVGVPPDSAATPAEKTWDIDVRSYETHARVEVQEHHLDPGWQRRMARRRGVSNGAARRQRGKPESSSDGR